MTSDLIVVCRDNASVHHAERILERRQRKLDRDPTGDPADSPTDDDAGPTPHRWMRQACKYFDYRDSQPSVYAACA